ncbi:MAG TPA: sigma-70 family RNA polymerase sigma factor [Euzebyales bacterium]|nr:sigma-70 family RNA polymerase sigma factor [Euzebyales bacterium]
MADLSVAHLLTAAADGDRSAWERLVDRYGRLVWSVVRSFGLDGPTADDVNQTVWLRLIEHCTDIRDPERLAGWLATTARREAFRVLRLQRRQQPSEAVADVPDPTAPLPDERLLDDELSREVYAAFQRMPEACQQLLRLLTAEPRLDYATIARMIQRPVGSIGPTRARCLSQLRQLLKRSPDAEARSDD